MDRSYVASTIASGFGLDEIVDGHFESGILYSDLAALAQMEPHFVKGPTT